MLSFSCNRRRRAMVLILVSILGQCAFERGTIGDYAHGQTSPQHHSSAAAPATFLVLANGQTMQGHISLAGEKYVLRLPNGSAIRIAQDRVLFTAASLSEAYWELAARTRSTNLPGQIGVFQWCLRNELFDEATNHLLVLQESDIEARQLAALDGDLETKMKNVFARRQQTEKKQQKKAALARAEAEKAARKKRVESMIGTRTVSIPDLHRSPLRPLRTLVQPLPAVATSSRVPASATKQPAAATVVPVIAIDHFGDPVDSSVVMQASYLESSGAVKTDLFSTPAVEAQSLPLSQQPGFIQNSKTESPPPQSSNLPAVDHRTLGPVIDDAVDEMSDPFDAEYFNQNFGTKK